VCTTATSPQSNTVCERMHQTVGNVLRTLLHGDPLQNIANAAQYVDEALSIAMHPMQAGVHSTLGSSPGNLVFNRDMFSQHSIDCGLECHHTKKRTPYP
jgi:hypothetical protein